MCEKRNREGAYKCYLKTTEVIVDPDWHMPT